MTFFQNLDAFLGVTGPQDAEDAWWLAGVDWPSDAHRNDFITALTGREPTP